MTGEAIFLKGLQIADTHIEILSCDFSLSTDGRHELGISNKKRVSFMCAFDRHFVIIYRIVHCWQLTRTVDPYAVVIRSSQTVTSIWWYNYYY